MASYLVGYPNRAGSVRPNDCREDPSHGRVADDVVRGRRNGDPPLRCGLGFRISSGGIGVVVRDHVADDHAGEPQSVPGLTNSMSGSAHRGEIRRGLKATVTTFPTVIRSYSLWLTGKLRPSGDMPSSMQQK